MFRIDRTRVSLTSNQDLAANVAPAEEPEVQPQPTEDTAALQNEAQEVLEELVRQGEEAANEMIVAAEAQASSIKQMADAALEGANSEAEAIREQARLEGYEEGLRGAQAECAGLIAQNAEALERVIAEISSARELMMEEMEGEIIDLCFEIIRKIAVMDRAKDADLFKSIIKKTLGQMELNGKITVNVSTEDLENIFPDGEAVFSIGDEQVTVSIVDRPELNGGDIVVESDNEAITSGVDSQIRSIELAFKQQLGKEHE